MIGKRLGHYDILQRLGSGGMGDVYLAEDSKLKRKVALKTLPGAHRKDSERRKRFEREAKTVAALDHPNIVNVYSVEEVEGTLFLTMELVQGKVLTDMIPADGFSTKRFLDIAIPIVKAVAAAHERGILHRDLKPANVMVGKDGRIRVLDFGLAKTTESFARGDDESGLSTKGLTEKGVILGTAGYMSPEQAQGEPVDHRSDIFSLGCLFYQMMSGQQPFRGKNSASVMASIIKEEPQSLSDLRSKIPREVAKIVDRCLQKDLRRRYQSALDLENDLVALDFELASGTLEKRGGAAGKRGLPRAVSVFATVLTAVLAGVVGYLLRGAGGSSGTILDGSFFRVTSGIAPEFYPNLSPDGEFVVFASPASGNWDIYLQRVGGERAINLTEDSPADDTEPALSADGSRIAFRSERDGGGIFIMGATGENVRRATDVGHDPAWSPDGREIAFNIDVIKDPNDRAIGDEQLFAVDVRTGDRRLLTDTDAVQPRYSPHGQRIAFWGVHGGGQRDIWTIPASGGEPVQVTRHEAMDWNPVWSPDGRYLYFASERGGNMNLWRVGIDETSGETRGGAEPVTTPSSYSQHVSFSEDGRRMAYVERITRINLQEIAFDGSSVVGSPISVTQGAREAKNPDLSPDGQRYAFYSTTDHREDLFVVQRDGTGLRQITADVYRDRVPRWSPDGERILFFSDRSGRYDAWTIDADGSGLTQVTEMADPHRAQTAIWSPDGKRVAVNRADAPPVLVDLSKRWSEQQPTVLALERDPQTRLFIWSWSPDGTKIGVATSGSWSFDLETARVDELDDFATYPVWLNDNRRLIARTDDRLFLLDSESGTSSEIFSVAPHQFQSFGISRDNRAIYYSVTTTEADIWIASLR